MSLVGEDALLGAAAASAFLTPELLGFRQRGGTPGAGQRLETVGEHFAGAEAIHALLAAFLALDPEAGGPVENHHAGGSLVHVLTAVTAGANEGLFKVGLAHADRSQTPREAIFLIRADGEAAHGGRV